MRVETGSLLALTHRVRVTIEEIRDELELLRDELGLEAELRLTLLAEAKEYRLSEARRIHLEKSFASGGQGRSGEAGTCGVPWEGSLTCRGPNRADPTALPTAESVDHGASGPARRDVLIPASGPSRVAPVPSGGVPSTRSTHIKAGDGFGSALLVLQLR